MTVRGNVEWPLKVAGVAAADRRRRADEALALLDIAALAERYPNEISGGQQQRAAIARTIAPRPGVVLFDEPLSNLDAKLRVEMRTELMRLHRATGATAVYVTHDQIEAMTMATHVAVINKGRIEQFGAPQDLIRAPASAFVATFVGTPPNNVVRVSGSGGVWKVGGRPMAIAAPREDCLAMFPPESVGVAAEPGERTLPLELAEVSTIAGRTMATALAGDLRMTAVLDVPLAARVGDVVHFALPAEPAAWFDLDGGRIG